ncbi:MAG: hypothetical protein KF773_24445 [Deltaproteobacteria bacterium]|nr:hypothetical protein [Deltaproteobacteria bacterium]MCW5804644.1 hypothetical protein [Deltaproteobacteria bacterium]
MRIAALLAVTAAACKVKDPPPIKEAWQDTFERDVVGGNYYVTSSDAYSVANGALNARGAHNHPLWLRKKLPRDVRIEFDCWSTDPRGDIKVELFGDGHSYDPDGGAYLATSYGLIFGGWGNSKSIIARLDEHGKDVKDRRDVRVVANQRYHWKIERKGRLLRWWIDDMEKPFLEYEDPRPLEGAGHEYFAINNWETDTWFDDLVITPL